MKYYERDELNRLSQRLRELAEELSRLSPSDLQQNHKHFVTVGAINEIAREIDAVVREAKD